MSCHSFTANKFASLPALCVEVVSSVWIFRGKKQRKKKIKQRKSPLGRTLHHATARPFSVSDRTQKSRENDRRKVQGTLELLKSTWNSIQHCKHSSSCYHSKHRRQHWRRRRRVEVIMKIEIWLHGELKQLLLLVTKKKIFFLRAKKEQSSRKATREWTTEERRQKNESEEEKYDTNVLIFSIV